MNYAALTSRLDIEIVGVDLACPAMLQDVLARVGRNWRSVKKVTIWCCEPEKDGSTHWAMRVEYRSGGGIHIGCLRRTANAETEFHS